MSYKIINVIYDELHRLRYIEFSKLNSYIKGTFIKNSIAKKNSIDILKALYINLYQTLLLNNNFCLRTKLISFNIN